MSETQKMRCPECGSKGYKGSDWRISDVLKTRRAFEEFINGTEYRGAQDW